jgi:hypothetical protein
MSVAHIFCTHKMNNDLLFVGLHFSNGPMLNARSSIRLSVLSPGPQSIRVHHTSQVYLTELLLPPQHHNHRGK